LKQNIIVLDTQDTGHPNTIISSLCLKNEAILKGYQCRRIKETTGGHKFLFACEMSVSLSVTPFLESLEF